MGINEAIKPIIEFFGVAYALVVGTLIIVFLIGTSFKSVIWLCDICVQSFKEIKIVLNHDKKRKKQL